MFKEIKKLWNILIFKLFLKYLILKKYIVNNYYYQMLTIKLKFKSLEGLKNLMNFLNNEEVKELPEKEFKEIQKEEVKEIKVENRGKKTVFLHMEAKRLINSDPSLKYKEALKLAGENMRKK